MLSPLSLRLAGVESASVPKNFNVLFYFNSMDGRTVKYELFWYATRITT